VSHRRRSGYYPIYPYPVQYPTYGPWWGSERILLVEPDPKPDPCPSGFVLSKATGKCMFAPTKKGTSGLGLFPPESTSDWIIVGGLAYLAWRMLR
jgi:hypothetical protein